MAYEIMKHTVDGIRPEQVSGTSRFDDAEEFVHAALHHFPDALYCIQRGETIYSAYRMINGQIVCHSLARRPLEIAA